MADLRAAITRLAGTLPKGSGLRRDLMAALKTKTALLKDGPVGRVLDKHWNDMHDISRELGETTRDYYDAAHFMGGDAEKDAEDMIKRIEKVQKVLDGILREEFTDLIEAEGKFVGEFGEPGEYSDNMRRKVFPRAASGSGDARLQTEMERVVRGAGKVLHAEMYEEAKGGGWAVVFDTEFAALKAYYTYRDTPGVRFGKSPTYGGWFVSVKK